MSGRQAGMSVAASQMDTDALRLALDREVDGEVRFDVGTKALYVSDASNYRQVPMGVVLPRTTDAVVETVRICHRFGAPIVSRGGGTALAGQTCNTAVVIDFSKHLNRILDLNPVTRTARVQPGVILDQLREAAGRHGLTFGPDPATHTHCTLGGMIGNNSCGVHSVMAGKTVDNVVGMDVLTYDGVRMTVGPTDEQELGRIISGGDRRGQIYRDLKGIRDNHLQQIRDRYPDIPRRVSGYNLDYLLPEKGFDVARALVGSESTCVTVLEATVRLVHSPPERSLLVLGYPDIYRAADHVPRILEFGPVGFEAIDRRLIDYMRKKDLHPDDLPLMPDGDGWLMVEFGADDKEEATAQAHEAMQALRGSADAPNMKLFTDDKEEHDVWEIRESGLGATANVPGMALAWPGWEDAAVHPDRLGDYLRRFRGLLDRYGYDCALYGHFGQGCVHCRITFDLMSREGIESYMAFASDAADLVVSCGGSLSGEHGDGQSRAAFLPRMYGPEIVAAFRAFKAAWDPDARMNPGKVVDAYRPDENLRLGEAYDPWQPETRLGFPADGGSFARATLRCVGVGKCRRTHDAFMCPSFLVTRDEKHSTRGRAHLLFEMFQGDLVTDGWRSREVLEGLDLCLGCKGCKKECPVNVDIATYKSEFLSHHYEGRLRPRAHYAMGLIGAWSALGSRFPRTANMLSQTPLLRDLAAMAGGTSRKRRLPRFARQPFTRWYRGRKASQTGGKKVLLYPDVFNDCFHPEVLRSAVSVLERWGYQVIVPGRRLPALRPLLHYGMLTAARRKLRTALARLEPHITDGVPLIFLEPSTASVFRDEIGQLIPDDPLGMRASRLVHLLDSFVLDEDLQIPRLEGRAILHVHCHEKAVFERACQQRLLTRMGLDWDEPQEGCCGMAGSFGFEAEHFDLSREIAEQKLLPAVRNTDPSTYLVADGFSCKTQISQGAGRTPLHTAQLLEVAFQGASR